MGKRKLVVEIRCNKTTCGKCTLKLWFPYFNYGRCVMFGERLEPASGRSLAVRCKSCLDAEEKP